MKKRHLTKAVALLSVASLSLTGCNSFISEDVASYPLAATMTSAELVDYYAKALEYDSVVSRNVNVHETRYEVKDIEGAKSELLKDLASQCEAILGLNEYKPTEASLKLVSNDTYNYVKGVIDNEVLSDGKVQNITGALGYYFVDIQYNISSKQPGTFKDAVNIIGLNGAFHKDYLGNYIVDEQYMSVIVSRLNEYYYSNGINKCATYDTNASTIKILNDTAPVVSNAYAEVNPVGEYDDQSGITDDTGLVDDLTEDTEGEADDILNAPGDENEQDTDISDVETTETSEDSEVSTEDIDNNTEETENTEEVLPVVPVEEESVQNTASEIRESATNYTIVTPDSRRLQLNTALINKIVGSSAGEAAMIPDLDLIYIKPGTEGTISGLGIYPAGDDGLKTFGFKEMNLQEQLH